MEEYYNLDHNKITLKDPLKKKKNSALLRACYTNKKKKDYLTFITPPLRCSAVRVWPNKNPKSKHLYSKCRLELEITQNEWRFSQFLDDLSERLRSLILKNGGEWFGYTFSGSTMRNNYNNLFPNDRNSYEKEVLLIKLSKELLRKMTKEDARGLKNEFINLRFVFKGVLVANGIFSEVWSADQIIYASVPDSSESEGSDEEYFEISPGEDKAHLVSTLHQKKKTEKPPIKKTEKEERPVKKEEKPIIKKEKKEEKSIVKKEKKEEKPIIKKEKKEEKPIIKKEKKVEKIEKKEEKPIIKKEKKEKKKKRRKRKKIILLNGRKREWGYSDKRQS